MTSAVKLLQTYRIIFFAGKGGCGKTTCATAFALLRAEAGENVLLVSTDPAHSVADILDQKVGDKPTRVREGLWALEINPMKEAKKYLRKIESDLAKAISPVLVSEIKRQVEAAYLSPGAEEAAIFDRFIELIENRTPTFDKLIFDTAPTGHTLRLFSLPEILEAWMNNLIKKRKKLLQLQGMAFQKKVAKDEELMEQDPLLRTLNLRRQRFVLARKVLLDRQRTTFVFVLQPERLSVLETTTAVNLLKKYGMEVAGGIINKMTPISNNEFLQKRRHTEKKHEAAIRALFGERILAEIPLLEQDVLGVETLKQIANYFGR